MSRRRSIWLLPAAVIAATAFAGAPVLAQDAETPDELVLGLVPSREADVLVENAKPLAEYLSQELGIPVQEFVPVDYPGLVVAMQTGQADIGAFGPVGMVLAADNAGADLILQSVRNGSSTYYTQWMTNNAEKYCLDEPVADENGFMFCNGALDSDERPLGSEAIALIEDGTPVSFVSATSASGYTFPSVQLEQAGIDHETGINPIFAGGHDNSVIALCNGDVEVGVSFNDARTILQEGDCDNMDEIVVFAYSPRIPNDGVAVRGELPDELKQGIADALIAYGQTEEGAAVLDSIYEISEFAPADIAAFDAVREAIDTLGLTGD
jgi:phosphonate transport system substrate-binding protein